MRAARTIFLASVGLVGSFGAVAAVEAQGLTACYLQKTTLDSAAVRPSPLGATPVTLGGDEATLCYGRPSARGRTIMGGLVPYGTPWRMGANEATALHLPFMAQIGTVSVSPGAYSLYAIPSGGAWTIVVNRSAQRWGIPINDEVKSADIGSFEIPVGAIDEMVEQLTYVWVADGPDSGRIVMTWEHTRLEIPIRVREK